MRTLVAIGGIVLAGAFIWEIGSRLSTDAVALAVGLLFGVLSGIPVALLVLAAPGARRRHDAMMGDSPMVVVIVPPAAQYPPARPFAAPATANRCENWELCPDCRLPITPDEHCPEWCGVPVCTNRQYRITGETTTHAEHDDGSRQRPDRGQR